MNELSEELSKLSLDTKEFIRSSMRKQFLMFVRKRNDLEDLQKWLSSSNKYISRDERNLLIQVVRYEKERCNSAVDIDGIIRVFRYMKEIPVSARSIMEKILSNFFLECKADLDDPKPINDEERFDLVLDGLNVTKKSLDELRELGVFSCGVHFGHRQLDLMGTLPISEFYAKISDVWGFESPENFFQYGSGTVPVGKLD